MPTISPLPRRRCAPAPCRALALLAVVLSLALAVAAPPAKAAGDAEPVRVGSKRFTESYVLGEVLAQTARAAGARAEHRQGLGSTAVVLEALKLGSIDVYPEYRGTVEAEILRLPPGSSDEALRRGLAALGLGLGVPLGFSNSYALAVTEARARELSLASVGDLRAHPGLTVALSPEFLGRADGWPGLARRYALPHAPVGIEHGVAYEALAGGRIAVTDIYTTDSKIGQLGLRVLADDLGYFPRYDALLLYRLDLPARAPAAWRALQRLQGSIDTATMIRLNGDAELRGRTFAAIGAEFVAGRGAGAAAAAPSSAPASSAATPATGVPPAAPFAAAGAASAMAAGPGPATPTAAATASGPASATAAGLPAATAAPAGPGARAGVAERLFAPDLGRLTREHVTLVAVSVLCGVLLGVPLGALAATRARWRQPVYAVVGVLQTVPSLALLAALIPLLGRIGTAPAVVALSLYALLPIVRNTATALLQVSPGLKQAGSALGLTVAQRWRHVDLPLALPVILAGVKTAAVLTVGTATIAAFIGAGGYGERIAQGLALNDGATLLAGAIPSAVLALATQAVFELLERWARGPRPA